MAIGKQFGKGEELLRVAVGFSGLSARKFAELIEVDERTVRYWLAQDREVPGPVKVLCLLVISDPGIVADMANAKQGSWKA